VRDKANYVQFVRNYFEVIDVYIKDDCAGYVAMVFTTLPRWIYDGQYTPTDFLVYLAALGEKGRAVGERERQWERKRR